MSKKVLIVGGGILGLSTAYYCRKEGMEVELLDQGPMTGGASYVNAGYLTPSHIVPLAAPGMMAKGLKWMLNSSSPFYMKPRLDPNFLGWCWQFYRASTPARVKAAMPRIAAINMLSKNLYEDLLASGDLGDFHLEKKGLLMFYKSEKEGAHERAVIKAGEDFGLEGRELNREELEVLQPGLHEDVKGGFHWLCDGHSSPEQIMPRMKSYLEQAGVSINPHIQVQDFRVSQGIIREVITNHGVFTADDVVLASGAWSRRLFRKLNLPLHMEGGKGYRINVYRDTPVQMPAILMDSKVAVTPMQGFTRFAGTMEFSGLNHEIRPERVQAIAKAAKSYYKDLDFSTEELTEAQCGLRPVTPDGMPYIGRPRSFKNLVLATGHAMMGWSLGPATGKLVSELLSGTPLSLSLDGFSPDRSF